MDRYKKNNLVIVIVVSLLFLLIAGVIYFFYFLDYGKENIESEDEKKDSLYKEVVSEEIIKELQNTIEKNSLYLLAKTEKDIDNINSIENSYKMEMFFSSIIKNNNVQINEIKAEMINEYFLNTFKATMYLEKEDFYCSCHEPLYEYSSENDKYIYNENHIKHDSIIVYPYYSKILEVKKKNDIYIIKVSYIWDKLDSNDDVANKGYASYLDALNNENKLFELKDNGLVNNLIEQNYESLKSNLHEYTYTFEKKNDKYLLINYEFNE